MKVFELNFNSRGYKRKIQKQNPGLIDKIFPQKEKVIFESFCFFPKTAIEKQFGDLYFLGEIRSICPKKKILAESAERIRNYYYSAADLKSSQAALKYSLFKTNHFLTDQAEQSTFHPKESFSLDVAVACLLKDNSLNLSKIGNPNVLLLSNGEAYDLSGNININCPNSQTFQNIVEGSLNPGDKIFIATNNVFQFFLENDFLRDLAEIIDIKEMKAFLKEKNYLFKEIHGACLIIAVEAPKKPFFLFRPFSKNHSPIPTEQEQ